MSEAGGHNKTAITQAEAFARIRLLRSPNIGPVTYRQLLARCGSAEAAIAALPDLAGRAGRRYQPAPEGMVEAEIGRIRKAGASYLFHDSPDYPRLLKQSEGAPPILTLRGDAALLHRPCVAVVGARNASAAAVRLAREFSQGLAEAGYVVVSGLARGIDGAAHHGALAGGATIGVIACGIDVTYPPEHAELQEQVAVRGLLLAEQPPGTEPLARHFPTRNRIIAGLAAGTVVVEAAPKSGSLITARLAGEMGREVMAIPGSPLDPRSHGCNQLIRDGAVLVQTVEDVIELVTHFDGVPRSAFREVCSDWMQEAPTADTTVGEPNGPNGTCGIAEMLTTAPVAVDELIRQSGSSPSAVQMELLELEIAGRLQRHAGGRVSLA